MESRSQYLTQPLTKEDILWNPFALAFPEDVYQLQLDTLNVYEGRVPIESFSKERQERIKNYYRFSAIRQNSKSHNIAKRDMSTLTIL